MSYIKQQCRRGMLELDFIFQRFLNERYDALSAEQKESFSHLLKQDDPILYDWLISDLPCADVTLQKIIFEIKRSFAQET